jgi:DNA-binding MarR family transcriptional regulator
MHKSINDEIEKIRMEKLNDPDIDCLILFGRTWYILDKAIELELKHLHTTRPQVAILAMLSRNKKPLTIDEMARYSGKEFNSVSALINRMEKKDLVKKLKKEEEMKTYVELTEKGSLLYHKKINEQAIHLIFGKLTEIEKKNFVSIIGKLRDTTSDLLGLSYKPPFLP